MGKRGSLARGGEGFLGVRRCREDVEEKGGE